MYVNSQCFGRARRYALLPRHQRCAKVGRVWRKDRLRRNSGHAYSSGGFVLGARLRRREQPHPRCQFHADRGGKEGTAGRLVHDPDRQPGDPAAEGCLRKEISRDRAAIRARRRKPDRREDTRRGRRRPGAGRRVRRHLQHGPAQARRASWRPMCRKPPVNIRAEIEGQGRLLDRDPALRLHARHQHHAGDARQQAPKTYQDLLDPQVEGQDGVESRLDRGRDRVRRQHPDEHGRRARDGLSEGARRRSASSISKPRRAPSSTRSSPASIPWD